MPFSQPVNQNEILDLVLYNELIEPSSLIKPLLLLLSPAKSCCLWTRGSDPWEDRRSQHEQTALLCWSLMNPGSAMVPP